MTNTGSSARLSRKQYASLEPHIKTLKEATIRKKWKKLPVGTQARVTNLLRTVERPALAHESNDRRNVEIQASIGELVEALVHRVPRMPFPPGTDESSFDFESTINCQRVLEGQLTANTHTIGLLAAEVESETELLEQEKTGLEALEQELVDLEGSDGKHKERLHPLARDSGADHLRTMAADYEARSSVKTLAITLPCMVDDPETKDMLEQLQHHLDTLQSNIEGTKDIAAALATSRAAVDVFNWRELRNAEYCRVYDLDAS